MKADIHNIGTLIRQQRISRGLTQEKLGEKIGVGKAQISKIESGKGLSITSPPIYSIGGNITIGLMDKK